MEYKHIFSPLLKVVSKILCHVFIVMLQLHNYKFEGKNNRRFCCSNWRHVGEHVERKWLSIRRSPCNKRSTYWSVLMCCKKTYWVTFRKKKSLYSTYSSFLVINVCNQGKTLGSPCRFCDRIPWKSSFAQGSCGKRKKFGRCTFGQQIVPCFVLVTSDVTDASTSNSAGPGTSGEWSSCDGKKETLG